MPLVYGGASLPEKVLRELHRSLREDLEATAELAEHPSGGVRDPASLVTARELVRATFAVLNVPGKRSADRLAAEVNLSYSTMVSVIDLVKSHSDVPLVPRRRPPG